MDKTQVLKNFFATYEILVVDKNISSRSRLKQVLIEMGCKQETVHEAGSVTEAEGLIDTKNIGLVLADYYISGGSGFDLFKKLREKQPLTLKKCFILVTSNISQSAVAKAAEEDVDSFIIKPYTLTNIQENLISTILAKLEPSEYIVQIDKGKDLLVSGKMKEALNVFINAKKLHQKPALALFYIGQVEHMLKQLNKAQKNYQDGLEFNNIHFKCLIGLYEIFMQGKLFKEAYDILKKIAKIYPASQERLTQIIRLAVITENFLDMGTYFQMYTATEVKTRELTNYIGAGMFVSGKASLLNHDVETAINYFDNIIVCCTEFSKFTRAIISLLLDNDRLEDAQKYFTRFQDSQKGQPDYVICEFLILCKDSGPLKEKLAAGLSLFEKKVFDQATLNALLIVMKDSGYTEDQMEPYCKALDNGPAAKIAA